MNKQTPTQKKRKIQRELVELAEQAINYLKEFGSEDYSYLVERLNRIKKSI